MPHKNDNPLFTPLPGKDINLGTGFENEEVIKGKTSEKLHSDIFGDADDKGLFNDIFGVPKKRHVDVTLSDRKARRRSNRSDF